MPIDPLASMSPTGRAFLARIGRRFGAREVQAQARNTLAALERLGPSLVPFGFGPADAELLAAALDNAETHGGDRIKSTESAYVHALGQAKTSRARARSVLLSAYRRLRMIGTEAEQAVMPNVSAVLSETAGPGGDDYDYLAEIERLLAVLDNPRVTRLTAACGGSEARDLLRASWAALMRIDDDTVSDPDPVALERDAIDGMIVELTRTAQFAARVAAAESGDREIAKAFRLRLMS